MTKNENRLNTAENNNQESFNSNFIGKYSYKNTEVIAIVNNNINTNENNIINAYYSTERKTFDKTDTNNKVNNSKKIPAKNWANFSINDKRPKNSTNSISKIKTNNKTNSNIKTEIKDNIIEPNENENENEKNDTYRTLITYRSI